MTATIGYPEDVYDADAHVRALRVPRIKIDGVVYEGRILSSEQVAPYFARLDALLVIQEEVDDTAGDRQLPRIAERLEAMNQALRPLLRMVFPKSRLKFWRPDPVNKIMALPLSERTAWLQDFFVCVRSWLPTSSNPRIRSSGSGDST